MSDTTAEFCKKIGLDSEAFSLSEELAMMARNTHDQPLQAFRPELLSIAMSREVSYCHLDVYDSPEGVDTKIVTARGSLLSANGRSHSQYARVLITKDNFVNGPGRRMVTEDIVVDPIAMGKGISWRSQTAGLNADGTWSCKTDDAPKIIRQKDDSDRKLGPAMISIHMGRGYEAKPLTFAPLSHDARLRLIDYLRLLKTTDKIPLADDPRKVFHGASA